VTAQPRQQGRVHHRLRHAIAVDHTVTIGHVT
jgi:hypothetical protein